MTVLAVDMGGTRIKLGLVRGGVLRMRKTLPARRELGFRAQLPVLEKGLKALCRQAGLKWARCRGIGLGFPGLVDPDRNRILSTNKKYDDAVGLELPAWSRKTFGLPLRMENDASLALLGEWKSGAGAGCDDFVMMTLGTGVGTAVMMGGKLMKGRHYQAGRLGGHLTVRVGGRACGCGNLGCLEAEASTWALEEQIKSHPGFARSRFRRAKDFDYRLLFRLAAEGDALAMELRERSLDTWGAGVVNLIHAYDPERVVLSGGIMGSRAVILPAIRERVRLHAWTPWGKVQVLPARHPETAALLGAELLFSSRGRA